MAVKSLFVDYVIIIRMGSHKAISRNSLWHLEPYCYTKRDIDLSTLQPCSGDKTYWKLYIDMVILRFLMS